MLAYPHGQGIVRDEGRRNRAVEIRGGVWESDVAPLSGIVDVRYHKVKSRSR